MTPLIKFNGFDADFFCYRLDTTHSKGLETLYLEKEITEWAFDNVDGTYYMGNEFPYKDHPKLNLYNPNKGDIFVVFSNYEDSVAFEKMFEVVGITVGAL